MSKSTFGWRQAGFTAVATALVFGGTLVGAGAANAAASTLTLPSGQVKLPVHQGVNAASAQDLTFTFDNTWNTNATETFTIAGNNCSTTAGIAAAIGFNSASFTGATITPTDSPSGAPTIETSGPGLGASSSPGCAGHVNDIFTVRIADARDSTEPDASSRVAAAVTGIKYDVGAKAPLGNVTVNAAGGLGSASAVNAEVVGTTFSYSGFNAVMPNMDAASLGTATIVESGAGADFGTGTKTVTLTLDSRRDGGPRGIVNFTDGVTPTITTSGGRTHTALATTGSSSSYSFDVTTPAGAPAATITVSGLKADVNGVEQLNLESNFGTSPESDFGTPGSVKALNVVDYTTHVGGIDRYATAAKMFRDTFGFGNNDNWLDEPGSVVLSNGLNFPDALSASYLAGQVDNNNNGQGTGILLTNPNALSSAAYNAIIAEHVGTVYITGGVAAVSQAIQNKLEATNVDGSPFGAKINVVRLQGVGNHANRYGTNQAINDSQSPNGGTVLVATGENFPDALGLGPIANRKGFPLVLTRGASLSPEASAQLDDISPTNVVIAGDTSVVSQSVADAIAAKGITVSRLAGDNRSETAAQVAMWATEGATENQPVNGYVTNPLGFGQEVAVANGAPGSFADALAAGPYAGDREDVILLSGSPTSLGTTGTPSYLGEKRVGYYLSGSVSKVYGLGSGVAVSTAVLKAAAASIQTEWETNNPE